MEESLNEIGTEIVDAALKLHQTLGPGLLESVYETFLAADLARRGFQIQRQVLFPLEYNGIHIPDGFRPDLVINGSVIIELKSVERLQPVHGKQILTYLRLMKLRLGYLLNFGEHLMRNGIKRVAN